jgi:hypothetical protein
MALRLVELDPRWLILDGRRVGFTLVCPTNREWRQSCFAEMTPTKVQWELFEKEYGEDFKVQGCRPDFAWTIDGGIEAAKFKNISVHPSIDGSQGGMWHGWIKKGMVQ